MVSSETKTKRISDLPGVITAVLFIAMASVALWDTTRMVDADSYVFPRAVAGAMIVFSILLIAWDLVRPDAKAPERDRGESTPRRIALVVAMLLSTLLMPVIGFVLSAIGAFAALVFASMYDQWTSRRIWLYPVSGLAIITGFYLLFAKVLQVPLPMGKLFG